jgi:hypothetical protein
VPQAEAAEPAGGALDAAAAAPVVEPVRDHGNAYDQPHQQQCGHGGVSHLSLRQFSRRHGGIRLFVPALEPAFS